jgi:hypothetical protein
MALASPCACELLVDDGNRALGVLDSGVSAAPDGDVDARTEASAEASAEAGCPPATCASQALSCQQACALSQTQCAAACHGNGPGQPCADSCSQTGMACTNACNDQCRKCQMNAACAPSSACPG